MIGRDFFGKSLYFFREHLPKRRFKNARDTLDETIDACRRRLAKRRIEGIETEGERPKGAEVFGELVAEHLELGADPLDAGAEHIPVVGVEFYRGFFQVFGPPRRERLRLDQDGSELLGVGELRPQAAFQGRNEARADDFEAGHDRCSQFCCNCRAIGELRKGGRRLGRRAEDVMDGDGAAQIDAGRKDIPDGARKEGRFVIVGGVDGASQVEQKSRERRLGERRSTRRGRL